MRSIMRTENSEIRAIFSFTHDAEKTGKLVLSRKTPKIHLNGYALPRKETFSFTGDAEQTGKLATLIHAGLTEKSKGGDVLEEYEATNTLSGMRRALLGHIPETWLFCIQTHCASVGVPHMLSRACLVFCSISRKQSFLLLLLSPPGACPLSLLPVMI
ncbi:hypothetical protein G5714_015914 [Onychostoma macrolepis]|uniref:Uncharacterized protein n=1 Tax=Onychostoma macrolepis TaxID=369639 RepID=A0A7J6C7K6_9TELE|nr:hypothetical protein G5714_015914 [Onychostoma macrolepis]